MEEKDTTKIQKEGGKKMIVLRGISKSFGRQVVLDDVNFSVSEDERTALVGPNGSGKSTLLKILAGVLDPDEGRVEISPGLKVAYFPQEITQENQRKTGREFLAQRMKIAPEKLFSKIGLLSKQLYFPLEKIDVSIENLSGGEKSKLVLMTILNSQADIFLLDEPTNNLDLRSLVILENFILASQQSFLIVSHDREFLNRLIRDVVEINEERHNLEIYRHVSYVSYLKERKKREQKAQEMYEDYQIEKQRLLKSVREEKQKANKMANGPKQRRDKDKYVVGFKKDRAKKVASHALAIEKRIGRLKEVKRPKHQLPLNLNFRFLERSGDIVFRLKDVEINRNCFHLGPLSWEVNYGDRIVILGPNGQGKTSLLQILTQKFKEYSGLVQVGSKVQIGYLPQEIRFKPDEDVLTYFLESTRFEESNARRILARFGFFAADIKTKTQDLSSGEKSRLILACLMAQEVNCLILDEPTNHLDPEALDRLEQALKKFSGTILLVSHDRYLIDQIGVTKTFLMENGKLNSLVDYHQYEQKIILET